MLVKDLIKELQKVKNKEVPVMIFNQSDDDRHEILLVDALDISVDINIETDYLDLSAYKRHVKELSASNLSAKELSDVKQT